MPSIERGDVRNDAHNVRDHFQRKLTPSPIDSGQEALGVMCPSSRFYGHLEFPALLRPVTHGILRKFRELTGTERKAR